MDIFDSDSFFNRLLADVRGLLRCGVTPGLLIPRFDGVIHMRVWEEHPGTGSSWQRHDHAWRRSSKTANASVACAGNRKRGIDWKTVVKWLKRDKVEDMKRGRTEPRSTVLTEAAAAMVVAVRRHILLPPDAPAFLRCSRPSGEANRSPR